MERCVRDDAVVHANGRETGRVLSAGRTRVHHAGPTDHHVDTTQIVSAAVARIYYAYPDPNSWSYSGLEGALVFGTQDSSGFWFRLVDLAVRTHPALLQTTLLLSCHHPLCFRAALTPLTPSQGTRGVIWDYEFYDGFEFHQDRTFFYSFSGDVRAHQLAPSTLSTWTASGELTCPPHHPACDEPRRSA